MEEELCEKKCHLGRGQMVSLGMVNRFEHGNKGKFGWFPSSNNEKYPYLLKQLNALAKLIDFPCTTFCINRNFQCKIHKDGLNQGDSVIVGLGTYTGGELVIEANERQQQYDIHNTFLKFDGALYPHGTMPFNKDRFSIVMYNPVACNSKGEACQRTKQ
jgi:hypothetical protein